VTDPMPQQWKLNFTIPDTQLESRRTFSEFDGELSLSPIDASNVQGELCFQMEAETIDEENAKACGMKWVQANLADSYLLAFGRVLQPSFQEVTLLNELELQSIPRTDRTDVRIVLSVRAAAPVADFEKSFDLRRRMVAQPHIDHLERSVRWFRKSKDSDDMIDQFVAQWIAFNVLYALIGQGTESDTTAIGNLISAYPASAKISPILVEHDETIRVLAARGLTSRDGQRNYSNELKNSLGGSDNRRTLRAVALCLWRIRNDIFHGGGASAQDLAFTRGCSALLQRIYRDCFCGYVGLP
jgi:hypothetical protein